MTVGIIRAARSLRFAMMAALLARQYPRWY
jgi:hypothetical protein